MEIGGAPLTDSFVAHHTFCWFFDPSLYASNQVSAMYGQLEGGSGSIHLELELQVFKTAKYVGLGFMAYPRFSTKVALCRIHPQRPLTSRKDDTTVAYLRYQQPAKHHQIRKIYNEEKPCYLGFPLTFSPAHQPFDPSRTRPPKLPNSTQLSPTNALAPTHGPWSSEHLSAISVTSTVANQLCRVTNVSGYFSANNSSDTRHPYSATINARTGYYLCAN